MFVRLRLEMRASGTGDDGHQSYWADVMHTGESTITSNETQIRRRQKKVRRNGARNGTVDCPVLIIGSLATAICRSSLMAILRNQSTHLILFLAKEKRTTFALKQATLRIT